MTVNWDAIVKTYDVRGLVDVDLTADVVEALGAGFADEVANDAKALIVGHDMRDSSPVFAQAFARGAIARWRKGYQPRHRAWCNSRSG